MGSELKILIVEDTEEDISLIKYKLKKRGIKAVYSIATTAKEFTQALQKFSPQIILSDHSLPKFNSFEALEILKTFQVESGKKIPFILVSGTVSEEFAVQCVVAGADDFVLKDRLKRLPTAIKRAIEKSKAENERKSILAEMMAKEASMKEAELVAQFGTWKSYFGDGDTEWSAGTHRIFGYKLGKVTPSYEAVLSHVHPDDIDLFKRNIESVIRTGVTSEFEFRIISKSGEVKHLYNRATLQSNGDSKTLIGFNFDITKRRLAENKLEEAYELARIGAWEFEIATGKITWTEVARQILEEKGELAPQLVDAFKRYKAGESRKAIKVAVDMAVKKGEPWDLELQIVTEKGSEKWIRSMGKAEMRRGKCVRILGSIQDIHIRKEAQIKLEKQFEQLKEIAWTQSHEVRAPLARLMGLIQILTIENKKKPSEDDLLARIVQSTHELDEIIRRIVRMTEAVT